MSAALKSDGKVFCALCMDAVNPDFGPKCIACKSAHHRDCWIEFNGCTTFGCTESPDMREYQSTEEKD
jgi:hypothetical protein